MFEKGIRHNESQTDFALFRIFPNYAGSATNHYGSYPVSYLELSRPTGKYVSRLIIRELNVFTRRHSILMIGNTCAPGHFFPVLDPDLGMDQFYREQSEHCGIFIANVKGPEQRYKEAITIKAEPFMILKMRKDWKTFDHYLSDMKSKYRIRANKVYEASEPLSYKIFEGEQISERVLADCARFLGKTLEQKTLAMHKDLGGIIHRFSEHYGKRFRILMYYLNNIPVGFISFSTENKNLNAWHVGYDAEIARDMHIYQRMLYDLIKQGIELKCNIINFGRTATEIKSTVGAMPLENHFVIYIRSKTIQFLLRFYKKYFFKPKEHELRHPFRKQDFKA